MLQRRVVLSTRKCKAPSNVLMKSETYLSPRPISQPPKSNPICPMAKSTQVRAAWQNPCTGPPPAPAKLSSTQAVHVHQPLAGVNSRVNKCKGNAFWRCFRGEDSDRNNRGHMLFKAVGNKTVYDGALPCLSIPDDDGPDHCSFSGRSGHKEFTFGKARWRY